MDTERKVAAWALFLLSMIIDIALIVATEMEKSAVPVKIFFKKLYS